MSQQIKDIEKKLKRPFHPDHQVKWRKGKGGKELCYIDARDVMGRLDSVFGINNWQVAYEWLGERMICSLACRVEDEWITKADGHGDTDIEPKEGGISKALVRAANTWGIGRYLYHEKAFDSNRNPASWATPEGYDALLEERDKAPVTKLHTAEK